MKWKFWEKPKLEPTVIRRTEERVRDADGRYLDRIAYMSDGTQRELRIVLSNPEILLGVRERVRRDNGMVERGLGI